MANAQTAIFKFESVNPIRSIIIDGQPWFVAQDVCSALRIQNVTQSLEKLDDDERSMFNIGHEHRAIFDSRVKEINIISESGLYTLILRCRDAVTPALPPTAFVNGLQVRFFLRSAAPEVTLKTRSRRKNA